MNLTVEDINNIEQFWVEKSRVNFFAYRKYMRNDNFVHGWFIEDICRQLQQFYVDLKNGKRPVLFLSTPPQHGKSWSVTDYIPWISGLMPELRSIYATYSDKLGIRCNLAVQRHLDSPKYKKIFPEVKLSQKKGEALRNTTQLEFVGRNGEPTGGQFRNTTTGGAVTGESLDLGIIDDAVKGREQANSITWSEKIWEWFTDDFSTRFSENAGLLIIMTRWTTHDIIARLKEKFGDMKKSVKTINYQAISTKDEKYRQEGEALFPELKSKEFLEEKKALLPQSSWESLYQGNPTITGGNKFKDNWWGWWKVLPPLDYKFITADTSQKAKDENDWNVFQCWGFHKQTGIYLLDKLRVKLEAPSLRREAEAFYRKHDKPRQIVTDPILRGMYIEDKASGIGLIQELKAKRLKIYEVPRNTDKNFRADDAAPFVEAGLVHLNTNIPGVGNLTSEARAFPNGEFDDDIDTLMTAVEVAFINKKSKNMLAAAMAA